MRCVVFTGAGGNEVISVVERPRPAVGVHEVLVEVSYAGLNPADLQQRDGIYPAPPGVVPDVPGLEVAGTVVEIGAAVSQWKAGDRVFGIVAGGGLATEVVVHARHVVAVPEGMTEEEAAAIPEAYMTAHDALRQGRADAGSVVLVHGATGAVGAAAARIALDMGAQVIAVARRVEAASDLAQLGATVVPDEGFAKIVRDVSPDGVDVVIELVGSPHFPGNLQVLRPCGRIVVVGVGAGTEVSLSLLDLMRARAQLIGTVLRGRPSDQKAEVVQAFAEAVLPQLSAARMGPEIDSVFAMNDAVAAFDRMAQPGRQGKVLLHVGSSQ